MLDISNYKLPSNDKDNYEAKSFTLINKVLGFSFDSKCDSVFESSRNKLSLTLFSKGRLLKLD